MILSTGLAHVRLLRIAAFLLWPIPQLAERLLLIRQHLNHKSSEYLPRTPYGQ